MNDKSTDAFKTIGEVASELGIPQHVLRFWETRFAQIRPLKRGGGRRYYRPEDVALLHGIRFLLYSKGFTIKGARRRLTELMRDEDEQAALGCLVTDAPFVERLVRHVLDRLAAERCVGENDQRNARCAPVLGQILVECGLGFGRENIGLVQHGAIGPLRHRRRCALQRTGGQQQRRNGNTAGRHKPPDQLSVPVAAPS